MSEFLIDTDKHLLKGRNVHYIPCPKNKTQFGPNDLDTLVIHYTAGRNGRSSADYLARPNVQASAHLVIGRDGEVYQLVPFDTISWHAGKSSYMGRSGYNKYSIGIELANAGILVKTGTEYKAWFGGSYMQNEVMEAVHRNEGIPCFWHVYTPEQLLVCEEISALLLEKCGLKNIFGHEEFPQAGSRTLALRFHWTSCATVYCFTTEEATPMNLKKLL